MLGADQAFEFVVGGVDGVSESFLVEICSESTHALYKRLWGAEVPMHEAWRWVHVAVNITESQVAYLVACATDSLYLNRIKSRQNFLDGVTEVRQRSSDTDLMIVSWFSDFKWIQLFHLAINQLLSAHVTIVREFEDAMFGTAKDCLTELLIFLSEWIVDNTKAAAVVDGKADEDSDCRKVALNEVIGAIEWVDPDNSIARVECLEIFQLHVILVVECAKRILDPFSTRLLALVKGRGRDAFPDGLGEDRRLNDWLDICNGLFGLLTHDLECGVERVQANFDCLLHFKVGNCHRVLDALSDGLKIVGLVDLADDIAALLAQEDAHRQELSDANVLVRDLEFGLSAASRCRALI